MAKKRKIEWYGVRTLFRLAARGKPRNPDKYFDPESTLVEDRVVLFEADSFASAIQQAEQEAREYSERVRFKNCYGQTVRLRFLGALEAYQMCDKPSAGCEVFSATATIPCSTSDSKLVTERFGKKEKLGWARSKFVDAEILSRVLTEMDRLRAPTRPEAANPKRRRI